MARGAADTSRVPNAGDQPCHFPATTVSETMVAFYLRSQPLSSSLDPQRHRQPARPPRPLPAPLQHRLRGGRGLRRREPRRAVGRPARGVAGAGPVGGDAGGEPALPASLAILAILAMLL